MPQATDSGSSNGLSGVKGWLLFLCITLVFLLPILKAGTTLYSVIMIRNLSNLPLSDFQEMIDDNPVAFINDLDNEQQKEVFRKVIPLLPDFQKCTEGFASWLLLLVASKTGCTMMGFLCGILLWMKKPFGAKLLKIYPIAILLGVFVCFISLIYWRSNHPVLFSLQELSTELSGGFYGGGTLIENLFASPNVLVAILSLVVVVPSVLWASAVFIYSRKSKRMQVTYPDAYKGSLSIPAQGAEVIARDPIKTDQSISALDDEVSTAGPPKVAEDHARKSVDQDLQQMSSSCPQCNSAVQPGEIRCTQCGTHLYGMQPASSGGTFKLIAVLGGGIIGFAAISGIIILLLEGTGRNKRAQFNERVGVDQMALHERIEKIERFRGRKFTPEMVKAALEIFVTKVPEDRKAEFLEEINNPSAVRGITEQVNQGLTYGEVDVEEISTDALTDFLLRKNNRAPFIGRFLMARTKANRIKCVNNVSSIGKGLIGFAIDNDDRLPWQLTPAQQAIHKFEGSNIGINSAGSIANIPAMRNELQTPKILLSPCDPARTEGNELLQENWANATAKQIDAGMSYGFCIGGDVQRPSTVLALTANIRTSDLATGDWTGADETPVPFQAFGGLNKSQGQLATADGSAKFSNNADIGGNGIITKAHINSRGGHSKGNASTKIILPRWD